MYSFLKTNVCHCLYWDRNIGNMDWGHLGHHGLLPSFYTSKTGSNQYTNNIYIIYKNIEHF